MKMYSKAEIAIIKAHLKACSKATGTPLNIRAALDDAGNEIYERYGVNRTIGALMQFYYSTLRKEAAFFGFNNIKNTRKLKKSIVVPARIVLHGKAYQLELNLTPDTVAELTESLSKS